MTRDPDAYRPSPDERVVVLVQEPSRAHPWLWLGAGIAGLAAYLFYSRGKPGWTGRDDAGKGADRTPPTPVPVRDDARVTFMMIEPTTDATKPARFRGPDGTIVQLDDLVARVKAGGRSDVTLKVFGAVLEGPYRAARELVRAAGIEVYDAPPTTTVGYQRGSYSRGDYR